MAGALPAVTPPPTEVAATGAAASPGVATAEAPAGDSGAAGRPTDAAAREVLLSASAARAMFPDAGLGGIVGRVVGRGRGGREPATIAGVFDDARFVDVRRDRQEIVVQPWSGELDDMELAVYLRATIPPRALLRQVLAAVREVDPDVPPFALETLSDQVDGRLIEQRVLSRLAGVLAAMGLALAAVGLYGVLGHAVLERSREIGVRSALGARPAQVLSAVVGRGVALAVAGAAVGLLGAAMLSRLIATHLYGVGALDVTTYAAGLGLLLAVALLASLIPARRALRISPVEALRGE